MEDSKIKLDLEVSESDEERKQDEQQEGQPQDGEEDDGLWF